MRVVLYAHDMEPITILELSPWAYKFIQERGQVMLPVFRPIELSYRAQTDLAPERFYQVQITSEKMHRNGETHLILFTHNEENAMLLKAAFLPGQQWALKEIKREEFAKGFLTALDKLSG